jgi:hypothetical protein
VQTPQANAGRPWTKAAGAGIGVLVLTGLAVLVVRRRGGSAPAALADAAPRPAPPIAVATNGARHAHPIEDFRPLELLAPVLEPEPEPEPEPEADPAPSVPPAERCTVAWWRGYVRSQFIAYAESGDAGTIVAESPSFAWRSNKPPPQTNEDALAAHTRLLDQLSELGWTPEDSGAAWFEFTFQRAPVHAPSRPEVPVV